MRPGPGRTRLVRPYEPEALIVWSDIPRGNFVLVFTITNIFNVFVPACSAVSALAALSRCRAAGASIGYNCRAVAPGVASGPVYLGS